MSAKRTTPASKKTAASRTGAIKADRVAQSAAKTRARAHLKTADKTRQAKRDSK